MYRGGIGLVWTVIISGSSRYIVMTLGIELDNERTIVSKYR